MNQIPTQPFFALAVSCAALLIGTAGCNIHYDVDEVPQPDRDAWNADEDAQDDPCEEMSDDEVCDWVAYECGEAQLEDPDPDCDETHRVQSCGSCSSYETCTDNQCVCDPDELCDEIEDDTDGQACGLHSVGFKCDNIEFVDCGGCDQGQQCDTASGTCRDCGVDCEDKCGQFVPDGCGNFVDCTEQDVGHECDSGEVCQDHQECVPAGNCNPKTECDDMECGHVPDGCGDVLACSGAADGDPHQACPVPENYNCDIDECICQVDQSDEEVCDDNDLVCGHLEATDGCGEQREIDCDLCPDGQYCDSAAATCKLTVCQDADFQTNPLHCEECENACEVGQTCTDGDCEHFECDDQGDNPGACNPFDESSCEEDDEYCDVSLQIDFDTGQPSNFDSTCRNEADAGDGGVGQDCAGWEDCQQGLMCIEGECQRVCERKTHEGCPDGEYCTNPLFTNLGDDEDPDDVELDKFGTCQPRCHPETGGCAADERCIPDPAFPTDTCTPNFQCVESTDGDDKQAGDDCNPHRLAEDDNGCPTGHTCAPVGGTDGEDDVCVAYCSSDADCEDDAECINADSPWQSLRYCELD